jgi:hypothetical protein
LGRKGFLYPTTGRPPEAPTGHHNLAWELAGDRRFRPEHGTVDAVVAEIASAPDEHVLLSSEGFSCAVHHHSFATFVQRLQSAGLQVSLLTYLRDQEDYAISLYSELKKHGLQESFAAFVAAIARDGRYTWRDWIFPFDYDAFLMRLESIDGARVIVRAYDASQSSIGTYCAVVGLSARELGMDLNIRRNQRSAHPDDPLLEQEARLAIGTRFLESNARVADRYEVRVVPRQYFERRHMVGMQWKRQLLSLRRSILQSSSKCSTIYQ